MENRYETERLLLRWVTIQDAYFIHKLLNSRGWLENIGDRGVHSTEDAMKFIEEKYFAAYQNHKSGPYIVINRETQIPMGIVGIYNRPGLDIPDIGFAFLEEFWGKGYAYEAAQKIQGEAKGYATLSAIALPTNIPSIRLLNKLGFVFHNEITLPNDTDVLNYYVWEKTICK